MKYKELVELMIQAPENTGKALIIQYLASQEDVIPTMMEILQAEREWKKEMIEEMNLNLSRNFVKLETPGIAETEFLIKETKAFYIKWTDKIRCCFKIEGLR